MSFEERPFDRYKPLRGPHCVSFEFRYGVYLPVMASVWDDPAHGPLSFHYYGA